MPVELIVLLGFYVLLWQGYQLRRRVSPFARTALFVHLAGSLLNSAQARAADAGLYGEAARAEMTFLVGLCILTVSTVALYLFRLAVDGYTPTSRRSVRAIFGGAAFLALMLLLLLSAKADGLPITGGATAFAHMRGALAYASIGFYLGGMRALVVAWMFRRSGEASRDLRLGVRVAALGLVASGGISIVRSIPPLVALFGGPQTAPPAVLLLLAPIIATPLQIAGMSYPLVASRARALAAWLQHRAALTRIGPLWSLIREAFPGVVLPTRVEARRAPAGYRLRRRRAECLDALYYLRAGHGDGCIPSPHSIEAVDQLRAAITDFERDHLGGEQLWGLVDEHRRNPGTDPAPSHDHELLERLADIVQSRRSTATTQAQPS